MKIVTQASIKGGRRTIETLSPDAQKYVSTAMLLQEFINEHDARLAQAFREKRGL